jgi:transposase
MIYKPEHVVDLETGAIVDVDVRPGDEHDTEDLTERLLAAEDRLNTAVGDPKTTKRVEFVAADKGYFKVDELTVLHDLKIRTAISDPLTNRRLDKLSSMFRRLVRSKTGILLLKRRAEIVERGFYQVLDCGGARRTTLRGRENIRKRYLIQAACANLSLLMRHLTGLGTPKQALAAAGGAAFACIFVIIRLFELLDLPSGRSSDRIGLDLAAA